MHLLRQTLNTLHVILQSEESFIHAYCSACMTSAEDPVHACIMKCVKTCTFPAHWVPHHGGSKMLIFSWQCQVLTLAHQIVPDMLSRNAADSLWEDLRFLLDMEPPPSGAAPGLHSQGVSVLAVDDAVTALEESLDWPRIMRGTALGTPAGETASLPCHSSNSQACCRAPYCIMLCL